MHVRDAPIRPPPMHDQQLRQEPKLPKRIVRRHRRLRALVPEQPAPDIRLLDHRHVVRPVPDRERHRAPALLDELHRERLLRGRHAAAHDGLALHRKIEQQMLMLVVAQRLQIRKFIISVGKW